MPELKEKVERSEMAEENQQSIKLQDISRAPTDMSQANTTKDVNPYNELSLVSYLQRPYPVSTFSWRSSQAQGTKVAEIFFPQALLSQRAIFEKMSRFAFLQCGFHISVRVNGTAFHYGKLLVSFDVSPRPTNSTDYTYRDNLYSSSIYPHIIVSPGVNEVKEFDIPFMYPLDYFPLNVSPSEPYGYRYPIASMKIWVLNPLSSSAIVPDVSVTVLANMTNVRVAGYSNGIPEALVDRLTQEQIDSFNQSVPTTIKLGKQVVETPEFEAQIGIDERVLALPDFNDFTPTIKNMTVGSWGTSHLSNEHDDHELHTIIARPALLTSGTVSSAEGPGTDLVTIPVNPGIVAIDDTTDPSGIFYFNTPLSFIANRFSLWRGTMNYTLQVVCSQFHSGRIQILYFPEGFTYDTTEPYELISDIIDIQKDLEYKFSIPYTFLRPLTSGNNGSIVIKIVNTLTFKETPIPDIYFNLWVCGGSDFNFSFPFEVPYAPTYNATVPAIFEAQIDDGTTTSPSSMGEYPSLGDFNMGIQQIHFNKLDSKTILSKPTLVYISGTTPPTGQFGQFQLFPTGGFVITPTFGSGVYAPYHPLWSCIALQFRFRRGSTDYIISSRSRGTRAADESEDDYVSVTGTAYPYTPNLVTPAFLLNTSDDNFRDGVVMRSSNLSFQPLSFRVPYSCTLKYVGNPLCRQSSTDLTEPNAHRLTLAVEHSGRLEVSCACGPDTQFFYQIPPPIDYVPNP